MIEVQEPAKLVTFEIESQKSHSRKKVTLKSKVRVTSHLPFRKVTQIKVTSKNKSHKIKSFFIKSHIFNEKLSIDYCLCLKIENDALLA